MPLLSRIFCTTWWIMYMIQVPMGSTITCAPSRTQEGEHVEVAVALGGLRPEFAGDLHDRLHPEAVDLDAVEAVAHVVQRHHVVVADKAG